MSMSGVRAGRKSPPVWYNCTGYQSTGASSSNCVA